MELQSKQLLDFHLIWLTGTCMQQQLVRWRITHLHLHRQFNYMLTGVPCLKNKPHHVVFVCLVFDDTDVWIVN